VAEDTTLAERLDLQIKAPDPAKTSGPVSARRRTKDGYAVNEFNPKN
jgi:hypothetical protein